MKTEKVFWISVLLCDDKIMFWKISDNAKTCNEDWYKQFYYEDIDLREFFEHHDIRTEYIAVGYDNDNFNELVFDKIAKCFFSQWGTI